MSCFLNEDYCFLTSLDMKVTKQLGKLSIKRYESYICNMQGMPSKEAQD